MGNQLTAMVRGSFHLLAGGIGVSRRGQYICRKQSVQEGQIRIQLRGIIPAGDFMVDKNLCIFLRLGQTKGIAVLGAGLGRREVGSFLMDAA